VLGAAAMLLFLRQALWGPLGQPGHRFHADLQLRDQLLFLGLFLLVLLFGFMPGLLLNFVAPATAALLGG